MAAAESEISSESAATFRSIEHCLHGLGPRSTISECLRSAISEFTVFFSDASLRMNLVPLIGVECGEVALHQLNVEILFCLRRRQTRCPADQLS